MISDKIVDCVDHGGCNFNRSWNWAADIDGAVDLDSTMFGFMGDRQRGGKY